MTIFQMVGAAWCEKCKQAVNLFQERGLWDLIDYIDVDEPEGQDIQSKAEIEHVPFFMVDGKPIKYVGEFLHLLTETRVKQLLQTENNNSNYGEEP